MKYKNSICQTLMACAAAAWMALAAANVCQAQGAAYPSGLSPDLQEVVKLSQAKMPDDVINNYINSTGKSFQLSADDIIYLNSQGVSAGVIHTLQTTTVAEFSPGPVPAPPAPTPPPQPAAMSPASMPQPAPAPMASDSAPPPDDGSAAEANQPTPPPPPEVDFQYFHDQLAPYGSWITIDGATYWRPDQAVAVNPDWRPYYDMGQWVQTDNGLYWQSDYTWGDIPFHYGRWVLRPGYGWIWAPDYTWGPAWVFWRHDETDAAIGWAPLPLGAVFVNGGFFFHGVAVRADFDFGLGVSCFAFVGYNHFHENIFRMRGREWAYHVDRARLHNFYARSVVRNDFRRDDQGRFVNYGIGRDRVENFTHVEHASFEERNPVGDRNWLTQQRNQQFHPQGFNHPGEPAHGQPGDFGADRNFKPVGVNNGVHEQNFGNEHFNAASPVSKVYRPPVSSLHAGVPGGFHPPQNAGGHGPQGGSPQGRDKSK